MAPNVGSLQIYLFSTMRKARTAFARFRSPNSRAVRHRPLATSTNAVAVDAHISNTIAERPKTTVQLPLPLATRNLLRAASDLAQRSIANPELWTTSAQDAVTDLREPRKPVVACESWDRFHHNLETLADIFCTRQFTAMYAQALEILSPLSWTILSLTIKREGMH